LPSHLKIGVFPLSFVRDGDTDDSGPQCQAHASQNAPTFQIIGGRYPMASSSSLSSPREKVRSTVPKLIDLTDKVVFGDVWERTELSKRDRSLITVAALVALYRPEQLRAHIERALGNGVTKTEISEIITHMAFYSGWPTAMTAALVAKEVFEKFD
jgi:4-carboxymuconolactone decarboxylase